MKASTGITAPVKEVDCVICAKAKARKDKINHTIPSARAAKVGEFIHSDVCGPMPVTSIGGNCYFVTFIDDVSCVTFIYLMVKKSELYSKFINFHVLLKNQGVANIKWLRCDNGGEYVSANIKTYASQHGIIIEYTAPNTPSQNGVPERKNLTLEQRVRALLFESGLSPQLWGDALIMSTHIENRLASHSVND